MSATTRLQLSAMMFLQFFVWGSWNVTAANYLSTIGFTASNIGSFYSIGPIAGIISPFFVGMIADRFFPAQRVLSAMHILGAFLVLGSTVLMKSSSPSPFMIIAIFFLYNLTFYPTLSMVNTVAMKNITDVEKEFPSIRVLGTIGWIVAGLSLSWLGWGTKINMFYMTAGAALLLGLFSFTLPHTPPTQTGKVSARQILGLDALVLLKDRSYLIFLISSFLLCIPLAFYYQITSRVVEMLEFHKVAGLGDIGQQLGLGDAIGLVMTFGQMSEIIFMLLMPLFFKRLGVKWMLAIGMLAWIVRYGLFSIGAPDEVRWMVLIGIVLHGICYDFFFVTGQIYTDQIAPKQIRAQAQGMLVLFTLGLGMAIGALVAGQVEAMHTTPQSQALGQQVAAKGTEIEQLKQRIASASPTIEKATIEAQVKQLETQKAELRRAQLKAIEWKPLWAKPAIFAAVILILFLLFFKNRPRSASPRPAEAYAD